MKSLITFDNLAKYSIFLSILPALYFAFFPGKIAFITILCSYPLIIGTIYSLRKVENKENDGELYVKIFIVYNIIVLFRGFLDASSVQDWKVLLSSTIPLFLFIHFSIYLGIYKSSLVMLFKTFFVYGLILCLLLFFISDNPGPLGFTHIISPIYLLILATPYVSIKNKILIFTIALFSLLSDVTIRSNILNIIIAFCILVSYLWRNSLWMIKIVKYFRGLFLMFPILFSILGGMGIYNVFQIGKPFGKLILKNSRGKTDGVLTDSRTLIYIDVFTQLKKDEAYLFGLGASGKTKTYFTNYPGYDVLYKEGRRGTESGMLTYIQWGGLIGGIIYFLLFFKASYFAIYKSKNWFCVMLGLWVAYKGFFSFIEDSMVFTIGSMFILVPIGMCLNKELRSMTDLEIKLMFNDILPQKRIPLFTN